MGLSSAGALGWLPPLVETLQYQLSISPGLRSPVGVHVWQARTYFGKQHSAELSTGDSVLLFKWWRRIWAGLHTAGRNFTGGNLAGSLHHLTVKKKMSPPWAKTTLLCWGWISCFISRSLHCARMYNLVSPFCRPGKTFLYSLFSSLIFVTML